MKVINLVLWLAASLLSVSAIAQERQPTSGPAALELRKVLVQFLSPRPEDVYVGPDGRYWLYRQRVVNASEAAKQVEAAPRQIEDQFNRTTPELHWVRPVLFEPGGRVWFAFPKYSQVGVDELRGYDGKTWIVHKANPKELFLGNCPNHKRVTGSGYNAWLDGRSFFVATYGVHVHDGKEWSYIQTTDRIADKGIFFDGPWLLPDASAKQLLAVHFGASVKVAKFPISVHSWKGGQWKKLPVSQPNGELQVEGVAVLRDNLWFLANRKLHSIPLTEAAAGKPVDIQKLIGQLIDDDPAVRKRATNELKKLGDRALPELETAVQKTPIPELEFRAKEIIAAIEKGEVLPPSADFMGFQVASARKLQQDQVGNVLIAASAVRLNGKELGPGLLIGGPRPAAAHFAPGAFGPASDYFNGIEFLDPVFQTPDLMWFTLRPVEESFTTMVIGLDLKNGKVANKFATSSEASVLAVNPADSTVILQSGPTIRPDRDVIAYRPGAKDDREFFDELGTVPVYDNSPYAVGIDGDVWVMPRDQRLHRLSAKGWEPVAGALGDLDIKALVAGRKGTLLLRAGKDWTLWSRGTLSQSMELPLLIQNNRAAIAADFADLTATVVRYYEQYVPRGEVATALTVDQKGRIWLIFGAWFQVLVDGKWVDVMPALRKAGGTEPPAAMWLLDDGETLYVSEIVRSGKRSRSYFAKIKDGAPLLDAGVPQLALPSDVANRNYRGVVGLGPQAGKRFISGLVPGDTANGYDNKELLMTPLTSRGPEAVLAGVGFPVFQEAGGDVWLMTHGRTSLDPCSITVVREGKVAATIDVPSLSRSPQILSDRPGSVYVCTNFGMAHLIRDGVGYKMAGTYFAKDGGLRVRNLIYVPSRRIALCWGQIDTSVGVLRAIRLPPEAGGRP